MANQEGSVSYKVVDLISENATIHANITTRNDIRVDGLVDGDIKTSKRLVIGPKAVINGNIVAERVDCFGKVKGDISVETVINIKCQAEICGDIKASLLSIETGAFFSGNCNMKKLNR